MQKNSPIKVNRAVLGLNEFDNNDTVLYGCIRVASELQPSEENVTLMKRIRQIGICQSVLIGKYI